MPGQAAWSAHSGREAVDMLPYCQQRYLNWGTIAVKSCAFRGLSEARWGLEKAAACQLGYAELHRKSPYCWLPAWAARCLLAFINTKINLAFLKNTPFFHYWNLKCGHTVNADQPRGGTLCIDYDFNSPPPPTPTPLKRQNTIDFIKHHAKKLVVTCVGLTLSKWQFQIMLMWHCWITGWWGWAEVTYVA